MSRPGRFITLEGGEGAGKSTQISLLGQALSAADITALTTREPGGAPGAEAIRNLVVSGAVDAWSPRTESLLFMAARLEHLDHTILPALTAGQWVLSDRFYDSTYVYQGIAKKVGTDWLDQLYRLLYGNLAPDLTLLLDVPSEVGLARAHARGNEAESRFERMGLAYHTHIREAFLQRAQVHAHRIHRVDATQDSATVHQGIIQAVNQRFSLSLTPAM